MNKEILAERIARAIVDILFACVFGAVFIAAGAPLWGAVGFALVLTRLIAMEARENRLKIEVHQVENESPDPRAIAGGGSGGGEEQKRTSTAGTGTARTSTKL